MTKKHFEAIAVLLRSQKAQARTSDENVTVCVRAAQLADLFQSENPRFDRARFLKACGVTE